VRGRSRYIAAWCSTATSRTPCTYIACRVAIPNLQTIYRNYFMFVPQVLSVNGLSVIAIKLQDNYKVCSAFTFFKVPFNDAVSCWEFITSVNERTQITGEVILTGESRSFEKGTFPAATSSITNPTQTDHDWTRITGEVTLTEESRSFQKENFSAATSSTTNPTRTGHDWTRTSGFKGWQLTVWAKVRPFASSIYSLQRNLNQSFLFFKDLLFFKKRASYI
jgi:hypothetical protein